MWLDRNSTDSEDSPLYAVEAVKDDNLLEMDKVFDNAERLTLFREYAQKGLLLENVDFIQAINEFKSMAEDHIVRSSVTANQDMKSDAEAIFEQFIKVSLRKFMSCHAVSRPRLYPHKNIVSSFFHSYLFII